MAKSKVAALERIFRQVLGRNGVLTVTDRLLRGEEPEQITVRSLMTIDEYNAYLRVILIERNRHVVQLTMGSVWPIKR